MIMESMHQQIMSTCRRLPLNGTN